MVQCSSQHSLYCYNGAIVWKMISCQSYWCQEFSNTQVLGSFDVRTLMGP